MAHRRLMAVAAAVSCAALVLAGCGSSGSEPAADAAATAVAEESAAPMASQEEQPVEEAPADTPMMADGDVEACDLAVQAADREPNSPSWIDMIAEAKAVAEDYDLMDALDTAYWEDSDSAAALGVARALEICVSLAGGTSTGSGGGDTAAAAGDALEGDAQACALARDAASRGGNSPSWIDMVAEAKAVAEDYDLMDALDTAYWEDSDSAAERKLDLAIDICDRMGL